MLLRRYQRLREASLAMVRKLDDMNRDQALRLPFPGFDDALSTLRKESN